MVVFHSYVSLPEGNLKNTNANKFCESAPVTGGSGTCSDPNDLINDGHVVYNVHESTILKFKTHVHIPTMMAILKWWWHFQEVPLRYVGEMFQDVLPIPNRQTPLINSMFFRKKVEINSK